MIYSDPRHVARAEAELALASTDLVIVRETLVSLAFYETDREWVEARCREFAKHENVNVREVALICIGHVAMRHQCISDASLSLLKQFVDDPVVRGAARDALDDVEIFVRRP